MGDYQLYKRMQFVVWFHNTMATIQLAQVRGTKSMLVQRLTASLEVKPHLWHAQNLNRRRNRTPRLGEQHSHFVSWGGPKFKSRPRDDYPVVYCSFLSPPGKPQSIRLNKPSTSLPIQCSVILPLAVAQSHSLTQSLNKTVNKYKQNSPNIWRHYALNFEQKTVMS